MATDHKQGEIEHMFGDFKPTNRPSNGLYSTVYEALFGGDWPVIMGSKEFLEAFTDAAIKITSGRAGIETAKIGAVGANEAKAAVAAKLK